MKYHRYFFTNFKINITTIMCRTPIFTSDVTMISHSIIIIFNQFTTNPTNITSFKFFIFFSTYDYVFIEIFSHNFFTILVFIKNYLNKFKNCIFSSVQHNTFTVFIINTHNFISKTTRNMILIFFGIRKAFIINTNVINIF